jgi:uncharacterized protein YycO
MNGIPWTIFIEENDPTATILILGNVITPLVASFAYSPQNPMVGGNIIFDASASYDSDGTIVSYDWDFGDGTPVETVSVPKTSHVFTIADVYNVNLTVRDSYGLTASNSKELDLSLEHGDILLCRSDMSLVPGKEWTHTGMYVGKRPVDGYGEVDALVEAVPGGVRMQPLSAWNWPNLTYVRAIRVNTDSTTRQVAADFVLSKIGQAYGGDRISKQVFMVQQKKTDSVTWYCSELVWAAYYSASNGAINLDQSLNGYAVAPDEIDSSSAVTIVGEHKEEKPETMWCLDRLWGGVAYCPVDLIVRDPAGRILSKDINEIPNAFYEESDFNDNNDLYDFFAIALPSIGNYLISVVPKPNAAPTDTYSLKAIINGQTMVLDQNVQIQNIPSEPYIIELKLNPADFDNDGHVDFYDFATFASYWMGADCRYPDWCEGTDLDYSGKVDIFDLAELTKNWLAVN